MIKLGLLIVSVVLCAEISYAETNLLSTQNSATQAVAQSMAERKAALQKNIEVQHQKMTEKQKQIDEAIKKHEEEIAAQAKEKSDAIAEQAENAVVEPTINESVNIKADENAENIDKALQDLKSEIERLRQVENAIQDKLPQ